MSFYYPVIQFNLQMLSPLDESELAAAWRRAAGPDGKVPVIIYRTQVYLGSTRYTWGPPGIPGLHQVYLGSTRYT